MMDSDKYVSFPPMSDVLSRKATVTDQYPFLYTPHPVDDFFLSTIK